MNVMIRYRLRNECCCDGLLLYDFRFVLSVTVDSMSFSCVASI